LRNPTSYKKVDILTLFTQSHRGVSLVEFFLGSGLSQFVSIARLDALLQSLRFILEGLDSLIFLRNGLLHRAQQLNLLLLELLNLIFCHSLHLFMLIALQVIYVGGS